MKVVFRTRKGVRGEIRLQAGHAVGSNARIRGLMQTTAIIEPDSLDKLAPKDGERYLRALPAALSGSYTRVELVE